MELFVVFFAILLSILFWTSRSHKKRDTNVWGKDFNGSGPLVTVKVAKKRDVQTSPFESYINYNLPRRPLYPTTLSDYGVK